MIQVLGINIARHCHSVARNHLRQLRVTEVFVFRLAEAPIILIMLKICPIILALCLIPGSPNYSQNYAGIIYLSLGLANNTENLGVVELITRMRDSLVHAARAV